MSVSLRVRDVWLLVKQWLVIAVGVVVSSLLIPGIHFESAISLCLAVLLISAFNVFLKPLLLLLGMPFVVLTLGFGILLINAFVFSLVGWLVPGFLVAGFWPAFWGALVVSLTTLMVNLLLARPKLVVQGRVLSAPKAKGGAKRYRGRLDDVIDV